MTTARSAKQIRKDRWIAASLCTMFAVMLGVSFASSWLYDLFCKTTGYGGTTQVASNRPQAVGSRTIRVRFDANVAPGLPWKFEAEQAEVALKPGETAEVYYTVRNISARETTGIAGYNVQPDMIGSYFNKIQCFCFTEQTLKAGESRREAVVFFLDPALENDRNLDPVQSITLSYTFAAVKNAPKPLAAVGNDTKLE